jgi:hypothetical protein
MADEVLDVFEASCRQIVENRHPVPVFEKPFGQV